MEAENRALPGFGWETVVRLRNPAIPRLTLQTCVMASTGNREEAPYPSKKYDASFLFRSSANRRVRVLRRVSDFRLPQDSFSPTQIPEAPKTVLTPFCVTSDSSSRRCIRSQSLGANNDTPRPRENLRESWPIAGVRSSGRRPGRRLRRPATLHSPGLLSGLSE